VRKMGKTPGTQVQHWHDVRIPREAVQAF